MIQKSNQTQQVADIKFSYDYHYCPTCKKCREVPFVDHAKSGSSEPQHVVADSMCGECYDYYSLQGLSESQLDAVEDQAKLAILRIGAVMVAPESWRY